jgi:hypothetical protein
MGAHAGPDIGVLSREIHSLFAVGQAAAHTKHPSDAGRGGIIYYFLGCEAEVIKMDMAMGIYQLHSFYSAPNFVWRFLA